MKLSANSFAVIVLVAIFCVDCIPLSKKPTPPSELQNKNVRSPCKGKAEEIIRNFLTEMGYDVPLEKLNSVQKTLIIAKAAEKFEKLNHGESGKEVNDLKKALEKLTDMVVLQGHQLGTIDVGEASSMMHQKKDISDDTEESSAEDNPRKILSKSRTKRSHKVGKNGTFDGEFELVVNGIRLIFDAYDYLHSRNRIAEFEKVLPLSAYHYLKNSMDFC